MLITIVICTYNRADILKITLPYFDALKIPEHVSLEVIIINNNSNDETEACVKDFIKKSQSDIRYSYFFESNQGLSHARNAGYKKASGEYIAYLDDECIVPEDWLEVAVKDIKLAYPAFLGGPYYGKFLPGRTNTWYKESFGDSYILQYAVPDGPLIDRYLSGGNLIIRRDVFDKIGLFDSELGMSGKKISYGEEQDFQKRLKQEFPDEVIYYDSSLFVWHLIRDEKISLPRLFTEALIRGQSSAKEKDFSWLQIMISPLLLIAVIARALSSALWSFIKSLFSEEHFLTLLHQDYKNRTWRDIGAVWYRLTCLITNITKPR